MKKYETVAAALISDIKSGKYPRGSALPTEERLTLMYGVSRQRCTALAARPCAARFPCSQRAA